MKTSIFLHLAGPDFPMDELQHSVLDCINNVELNLEDAKAPKIRNTLLRELKSTGWSSEVRLSSSSGITITSMRQEIGLCLQTGNVSRIYADLLKVQYLFVHKRIRAAVIIVFKNRVAKEIGSNMANYERLVEELQIFKNVITVPTLVIGLE